MNVAMGVGFRPNTDSRLRERDPRQVLERAAALAFRYYPSAWGIAWVISAFLLTTAPPALAGASLVLDAQGTPHIAFERPDGIKYAVRRGRSWHVETVAPEGGSPSLALGRRADDHVAEDVGPIAPHIAFLAAGAIRYATQSRQSWHVETVTSDGGVPSLAIDQRGGAHIGYLTVRRLTPWLSSSSINYAARHSSGVRDQGHPQNSPADGRPQDPLGTRGSWSAEVVRFGNGIGGSPSLALDSEDRPSMVYPFFDSPDDEGVAFAQRTGSTWDIQTACNCASARAPVLVFDGHGNPRVAFTRDGLLAYFGRTEEGWTQSQAIQDNVRTVSLAVEESGRPHLIYYGFHDEDLTEFVGLSYANQDAGRWIIEDLVPNTQGASIAVDGNGVPHISYYDPSTGELKYATRLGPGSWETETVEAPQGRSPRPGQIVTRAEGSAPIAAQAVVPLALDPILPTPSSGPAHVRFSLPRRTEISLGIFDAQGRRIRMLASGWLEAGRHDLLWNGTDDVGEEVGLGLYFARLVAEGRHGTQRIVWVR